jgi:small subunit ribosomal protein S20
VAHSLSAKKRIRQNETRRARNRARKSEVKGEVRKLADAMQEKDVAKAQEQFRTVVKKIDQIAVKGTLHKNTAARKKSRLAKRLNKLSTTSE